MDQEQQEFIQKEAVMRQFMIKNLNEKYFAFINSIKEIPISPQVLLEGLKMMDFGILWIKEAVSYSPIIYPASPVAENITKEIPTVVEGDLSNASSIQPEIAVVE